ncbi:ATP-binding protein [candidate division CSSED10-310 bacterium]|uniref:histidine kinase n=1 Tax=candidate division CSSED10-310 bacterium TaxID=2855610 RepID=A0ABV6Z2E4_UNCC1
MSENYKNICLEIIEGPDIGKKFYFENDVVTIGRSKHSDIILSDHAISRQHLQISQSEADPLTFILKDLKSRNGVFIDDNKILQGSAHCGQKISVGESSFILRRVEDENAELMRTASNRINIEDKDTEDNMIAAIGVDKVKLLPLDFKKVDAKYLDKMLQTLYKIGEIITNPARLEEKLAALLDIIFEIITADNGCILVKEMQTGKLEPVVVKHRSSVEEPKAVKVSWTIVDKCIKERIGILAANATLDPRFSQAESIVAKNLRSVLAIPIIFHDIVRGVIFLNTSMTTGIFTEKDLEFVTGIANETAVVIEHHQFMKTQIAREKMAEIGELVASLSHYIKNILFTFSTSQTLLEKAALDQDLNTIQAILPLLKNNTDRITDLVMDLLYFSKERKPLKKMVNLHEVVQEVTSLFRPVIEEQHIELNLELSSDIPSCKIDPQSFFRVFLNLIKNALEAIRDDQPGIISIQTSYSTENNYIECSISDNGAGIPQQNLETIFHYLFSTKGYEGTGIGLFITKQIIEDHAGIISVHSELEKGTTFTIHIPIDEHNEMKIPLPGGQTSKS